MINEAIAVTLSLCAIAVNLLVGNRKRYGWSLALVCEALWAFYSIRLHQYGLLIGVPFFASVYARNYLKWRTV